MNTKAAPRGFSLQITDGVRVVVPAVVNCMAPFTLMEQEDAFEDEIHFLRAVLQPGDRAVDVGATYGVYALAMAKRVGPEGRVWAFEPGSVPVTCLGTSAAINEFEHLSVIRAALRDAPGEGRLLLQPNPELAALVDEVPEEATAESVTITTLDDAATEYGIDGVSFINIDACGDEALVLDGARELLTTDQPLVMLDIRKNGLIDPARLSRLTEQGFGLFRLVPGLGILTHFDPTQAADDFLINLFAATPERQRILAERGLLAPEDVPAEATTPGAWKTHRNELECNTPFQDDWGDGGPVGAVLDHYAAAHDPARGPGDRVVQLARAAVGMAQLWETEDTPWRRMTLARLLMELGSRSRAAALLGTTCEKLLAGDPGNPPEPFLPPHPRYDHMPVPDRVQPWAAAACIEAFERARAFSTYFSGTPALGLLDLFGALGLPSPQMARRRQLLRMLDGQQSTPEAEPVLELANPENLNPQIWNRPENAGDPETGGEQGAEA